MPQVFKSEYKSFHLQNVESNGHRKLEQMFRKFQGTKNGTERNRTEQNGTELNRTEQNGTERNRTEQNGTQRELKLIFYVRMTVHLELHEY
jgi:hypothetical protein